MLHDKIYCQRVIFKLFNKMEECCLKMTSILDPKQIELTLGYLDLFRVEQTFSSLEDEENSEDDNGKQQEFTKEQDKIITNNNNNNNPIKTSMLSTMKSSLNSTMKFNLVNSSRNSLSKSTSKPIIKSSMERTISCPLDQVQSSKEMLKKTEEKLRKLRRHSSENRIDDHLEFEPVELVHLNIKASLISLQSKLNQFVNLNLECYKDQKYNYSNLYEKIVNEMKPSTKKLFSSIDSLMKISAISYAIESLKLSKDQSEYFYLIRSRRSMVFSQVLSTFTIALMSELTSPKINRNDYLDDLNNLNSFNNNFNDLHDLGDLNELNDFNDKSKYLNQIFEQGQILCFFEGLLSCYAEEIGMLQDMEWAIKELNNSVKVLFVNLYYDAGQFKKYNLTNDNNLLNNGVYNMPLFEGNGYVKQMM